MEVSIERCKLSAARSIWNPLSLGGACGPQARCGSKCLLDRVRRLRLALLAPPRRERSGDFDRGRRDARRTSRPKPHHCRLDWRLGRASGRVSRVSAYCCSALRQRLARLRRCGDRVRPALRRGHWERRAPGLSRYGDHCRSRAGEPVEDLLAHYTSRHMHGFLRHLQMCLGFYQSGGPGSFWQSEAALLQQGIEWAGEVLQEHKKPPTHRLVGRQLEPIRTG